VDKVFLLENDNVDASQKNVIFLAGGEKANNPIAIAGMYVLPFLMTAFDRIRFQVRVLWCNQRVLLSIFALAPNTAWDHKVDCVDFQPLYLVSLDPQMKQF